MARTRKPARGAASPYRPTGVKSSDVFWYTSPGADCLPERIKVLDWYEHVVRARRLGQTSGKSGGFVSFTAVRENVFRSEIMALDVLRARLRARIDDQTRDLGSQMLFLDAVTQRRESLVVVVPARVTPQ